MDSNNTHMTVRLRFQVKLLDTFAGDLSGGTQYERDVARLLEYVAKAIVNHKATLAADAFRISGLGQKPRADRVAAAQEAAQVAVDRLELDGLELPDSYTGIGG